MDTSDTCRFSGGHSGGELVKECDWTEGSSVLLFVGATALSSFSDASRDGGVRFIMAFTYFFLFLYSFCASLHISLICLVLKEEETVH